MQIYKKIIEKLGKKSDLSLKQQKLFDFSNDAFFTVKKIKFSKELLFVFFVSVFSITSILAPVFADEDAINPIKDKKNNKNTVIIVANGAILSEAEARLAQQGLKLLENKTIIPGEFTVIQEKLTPPPHLNYLASDNYEFIDWGIRTITAYNSEAAQTDGSPCVTANMFNVCEHGIEDTIAANFLKFGTKVRIPELFGNRVFIVRDRMNSRYPDRVDVWMINKEDSKNFGVRRAKIEVVVEKSQDTAKEATVAIK